MKAKLGNEAGFSFLEIVIALGIIMILVSALVPVVSTQLDNAKIARAKDDVQLIAAAIGQFNADTDEWPIWKAGNACTNGDSFYNYLVSADGQLPNNINLGSLGSGYDTIEDQLVYNMPGGATSSAYPDEAGDTTAPWRGPYLHGPNGGNNQGNLRAAVSKDPWGNKYVANVWALAPANDDGSTANHYVAVVLSAGPNEKIDTPITTKADMKLRDFQAKGDDIVCVIR